MNKKSKKESSGQYPSYFGEYQCLSYVLSCIGMVCYFCHFLLGYPTSERAFWAAAWEIFVLLLRTCNEAVHAKLDAPDILHHLAFLVGATVVYNGESDHEFYSYLLCHLQILHFPMVLWYMGCRRSSVFDDEFTKHICCYLFPTWWVFCVAYRTGLMICAAFYADETYLMSMLFGFGLVLIWLDIGWTKYFFTSIELPFPVITVAIAAPIGLGFGLLSSA